MWDSTWASDWKDSLTAVVNTPTWFCPYGNDSRWFTESTTHHLHMQLSKRVHLLHDSPPPPTHSAAKHFPSSGVSGSQKYDGSSRCDLPLMTWPSTDSHLRQAEKTKDAQEKKWWVAGNKKQGTLGESVQGWNGGEGCLEWHKKRIDYGEKRGRQRGENIKYRV